MDLTNFDKSARDTINKVTAIRDTLTGLGIIPEDPCDFESITADIKKVVNKLIKEFKDTVDSISVKIGGQFIVTSLILLSSMIGAQALNWYDTIVNDFIYGTIIGGIASVVAMVISAIPAAEIYLQYQAAKTLRRHLYNRITLSRILQKDVDIILDLLKSFNDVLTPDEGSESSIQTAINYVKQAEQILGFEKSKVLTSNNISGGKVGLNIYSIREASNNIDMAVNILTSNEFLRNIYEIEGIRRDYSLKTASPVNMYDPSAWVSYFININKELYSKYFSYSNERDRQSKYAVYRNIMQRLLRSLPTSLKILLMQQTFKSSTSRLINKLPISGATNNYGLGNIKDKLDKMYIVPSEVQSIFGIETMNTADDPFFINQDTKDLTIKDLNNNVKIFETLILLFPQLWGNINLMSNLYMIELNNALDQLQTTRIDMEDSLDNEFTELQLQIKKLTWATDLLDAKKYLRTMTGTEAGLMLPGVTEPLTGLEVEDLILGANDRISSLKRYLIAKSWDEINQVARTEPIEKVIQIAQSMLLPIISNIAILVSPMQTKKLISNMQSLKVLLALQIKLDEGEMATCDKLITFVETHQSFPKLQALFDQLIKALKGTPGANIAEELMSGDISTLATYYEGAETVSDIAKIFNCGHKDESPWYMNYVLGGLSIGTLNNPAEKDLKRLQKEITTTMNSLKDKKDMIMLAVDNTIKTIEKLTKTVTTEVVATVDTSLIRGNTPVTTGDLLEPDQVKINGYYQAMLLERKV